MKTNETFFESNRFLKLFFDKSEAALLVIDRSGVIVLSNQRAQQITGYTSSELHGQKGWREFINEQEQDDFNGYLELLRANEAENKDRIEVSFRDKDGIQHAALVSAFRIPDENMTAISFVDISEQKEYEQMLEKAKEEAENSERLKAAFLANMSHEIRTPINGIVGFADLLKLDDLSENKKALYLDQVIHGSHDLLRLIEKLITISRLDSGQLKINKREFNLNARLKDLKKNYSEELLSRGKKNIELVLNPGKDEDEYNIYGDPIKLTEILNNLIENAIKFTESGRIEFGYYNVDKEIDEEASSLLFFVKDSGIGIDKAKKKIIFDRFVKIINKDESIYKGAGIGLSICKEVLGLMGGNIWVESTKGSGSRFFFTYPLDSPKIRKQQEDAEIGVKTGYDWSDKKILVAEDIESNFLYIKELISPTNVKILRARDGIEAIEIFEYDPSIDLVVMDILMPGMDGHEATNAIRNIRPEVPVIAQSAFTFEGDIQNGLYAGCFNDYIMKPYTRKVLLAVINKYFINEQEA